MQIGLWPVGQSHSHQQSVVGFLFRNVRRLFWRILSKPHISKPKALPADFEPQDFTHRGRRLSRISSRRAAKSPTAAGLLVVVRKGYTIAAIGAATAVAVVVTGSAGAGCAGACVPRVRRCTK